MCGIAGIHFKDAGLNFMDRERFVANLLLGIENRGRHATGMAWVTCGGRMSGIDKEAVPAKQFVAARLDKRFPDDLRTILLHTRWETQGSANDNLNNHPIAYSNCYLTHNGHIYNDDQLFKDFQFPRHGQVDSEILAALVSDLGYGFEEADKALTQVEGNLAIAAINPINCPDQTLLARGSSSPLFVLDHEKCIVWASTNEAIEEAWAAAVGTPPSSSKIRRIPEGEILLLEGNAMEVKTFVPDPGYVVQRGWSGWTAPQTGGYISGGRMRPCLWCQSEVSIVHVLESGDEVCSECYQAYEFGEVDACHITVYRTTEQCAMCQVYYDKVDMEIYLSDWVCDDCMAILREYEMDETSVERLVEDNSTFGYDPVDEWILFGKREHDLYLEAIEATAAETSYPPAFIEWVLFMSPAAAQQDTTFEDLRMDIEEQFNAVLSDIYADKGVAPFPDHFNRLVEERTV